MRKEYMIMKNMKTLLALLFAVLMLVGLVGCSDTDNSDGQTTEPSATTPTATNGDDPTPSETAPSADTEPADSLTLHENTYFTVQYNANEGWTVNEDEISVSDYGGDIYLRNEAEDLLIKIGAYEESASSFRSTLNANDVDMKAYVEGTWITEEISGLQMAAVDKEDGEWYYFGRNEAAGVSYTVHVFNREDPRVGQVLEQITFTASATDNIDPPWPWEGEPFAGDTKSQIVGSYTLTAQFLPMAESLVTYETFDHDIVVMGDKVYLLSDGVLYRYAYDGAALSLINEISLPDDYATLEKDANGNLVMSGFMKPVFGHDGESAQYTHEGPDYFSIAPDGTWGISWFVSGEDCMRYTFENYSLTGSAFPFAEVKTISQVCIDSNYILVSGYAQADEEYYVFVYDYDGQLKMQLNGDPDGFGLGSVTYAVSTDNGFLALDANMRKVVLWAADGTWIGDVADSDLFGTDYPWLASAHRDEDGSILLVISDERPDESADEVLVFKLSGF